ncbi:O-antigen ligase family protein [Aeromonas caviae]|uniref:O-antigen ligase family protein n=1 Tax=Aeromonas caviae TaxID=648 RepID=UPI00191E5CE0|nr:O-antigen ligase family protein [Aeromonas caviae]MBL0661784.1 O-antigen ligase family protein [Aeromonas caviae]
MKDKFSIVSTVILSLVVFIPSIKFFIFSPVVNVILFIMMTVMSIYCMLYKNIQIMKGSLFAISGMIILFLLHIFSPLLDDRYADLVALTRIIFILQCVIYCAVVFNYIKIKFFLNSLVFYSLVMSLLFFLGVVKPSGSGELSYLIIAMQVLIGFSVATGYLFHGSGKVRLVYLSVSLILAYTVLSLAGRTAIFTMFSMLLIVSFFKSFKTVMYMMLFFLFIGVGVGDLIISYFYDHVFDSYFIYKMELLASGGGSDPRFETYKKSLGLILDNPFGLGLNNYIKYLGYYPHNILLEIALNVGILGVLIFIYYIVFVVVHTFINRHVKIASNYLLPLFYAFLSLLISWMTSNDLASSYGVFILISLLVLVIVNIDRQHNLIET